MKSYTIKVVPHEPMFVEGRRVIHIVCQPNREDSFKRKKNMQNNLVVNKKKVIHKNTGDIHESIAKASEETGISITAISKCCNKKQKFASGHKFEFV